MQHYCTFRSLVIVLATCVCSFVLFTWVTSTPLWASLQAQNITQSDALILLPSGVRIKQTELYATTDAMKTRAVRNEHPKRAANVRRDARDAQRRQVAATAIPLANTTSSVEFRRASILEAFYESWMAYRRYAWGLAELMPLSRGGNNWGAPREQGLGATIVDAMSSLWLMGYQNEFLDCVKWVEEQTWDVDVTVKHFEIVIRILGGILSAFELSGEVHKGLLASATRLGDRLLPVFDTDTRLPHSLINLHSGVHHNYPSFDDTYMLSEIGSIQLEYSTLSYHTGNSTYHDKVFHVMTVLKAICGPRGLCPMKIKATKLIVDHRPRLDPVGPLTLGGGADSYYEYLLKLYLLTDGSEPMYRNMFINATQAILHKLVRPFDGGDVARVSDTTVPLHLVSLSQTGTESTVMEHLSCFTGGMFALGAQRVPLDREIATQWMKTAKGITKMCYLMYKNTPSGIAADSVSIRGKKMVSGDVKYILRPETVESVYYLWRFTKDTMYREWGWDIFTAIRKHCRVDGGRGGYSGLQNVGKLPPKQKDNMDSFWLSETLKYLYLLFSDDDVLNLNDWILTTEAHPLRIRKKASDCNSFQCPLKM